ncbi:hypothetical protein MXD61_17215 [Frankia sp. AgPm24]|uniref:hypothetical protein n=1 Tax=Frankia sp. AgPm24 TaxID=631128 RepID=UPI00200FD8B7|nr:hypothetical protein [Frankia sp. AgPm24]MCK9923587.1 hypothetical protein [Frankia sp. AgPm24]
MNHAVLGVGGTILDWAGDRAKDGIEAGVGAAVGGVWGVIVGQFNGAAVDLIGALMDQWPKISSITFNKDQVSKVTAICTVLGALIAVMVLLISIVRTQLAADGSYVTAALVGLVKAVIATAVTATVVQTAAAASGEICAWIVRQTNDDQNKFMEMVRNVAVNQSNLALTLVFSIVAIVTVLVLWAEIMMVKLALLVLVATAPLGAAGLLSDRTSMWWQRQAMATFRLLLVPPTITLCFSLGFVEASHATGVQSMIVALMTLAAAVLCWPALARFFAVDVDGQVSGGLGLLIGAASGLGSRASSMSGGGGSGGGNPLDPTMLQRMGGGGAGGGAAGAAGGAAAGAAGFLPMAATAAVAAVGGFQRQLGRTAAHAGLGGIGESPDTPWLRGRGGGRGAARPSSGRSGGGRGSTGGPPAPAPVAPSPGSVGGGPSPAPQAEAAEAEAPVPVEDPGVQMGASAVPRPGDGLPIAKPPPAPQRVVPAETQPGAVPAQEQPPAAPEPELVADGRSPRGPAVSQPGRPRPRPMVPRGGPGTDGVRWKGRP